jgi:excisionase family DNA binding protein
MEDKLNLLSIGEASEYLGVSIDTLRRWEKKGKIISYRSPGGHRYFKKSELDNMFGRKYERSQEERPRKEYETVSPHFKTNLADLDSSEDEIQSEVEKILTSSEYQKKDVIDREPKEILIPKIQPIRIISETKLPEPPGSHAPDQNTSILVGSQRLIPSFSALDTTSNKNQNGQLLMIIVSTVVLITAILFVVFYLSSQNNLISPI